MAWYNMLVAVSTQVLEEVEGYPSLKNPGKCTLPADQVLAKTVMRITRTTWHCEFHDQGAHKGHVSQQPNTVTMQTTLQHTHTAIH